MNRKNMPLILMLAAGAVTCIIALIQNYSLLGRMAALFFVMLLFYLLGSLLKWLLDYFDRQNAQRNQNEGEVIEKEAAAAEDAKQEGVGDSNG